MIDVVTDKARPLVSLIVTPCDRRDLMLRSLRSATAQDYANLQIILANDGSDDLPKLAASPRNPRIALVPSPSGRRLGPMLNAAVSQARGEYVAYLTGPDVHYAFHVSSLVAALSAAPECQVAYGDFYKTYCKLRSDAKPVVMGKAVAGGDDFDRMLLSLRDCIRLSAVMHRRGLLHRAGLFDESLEALAEWDLLRRLAFYTDFVHVPQVTGEFFCPVDGDAWSSAAGRDDEAFAQSTLAIRAKRPPKPWPKMPDVSIIFVPHRLDAAAATIDEVRRHTFVPYRIYLPLAGHELGLLDMCALDVVGVPVAPGTPQDARVDKALARCEGDYAAVVLGGLRPETGWVEFPLQALMKTGLPDRAFVVPNQPEGAWAAVFRRDRLLNARRANPALSVRGSVQEAGIVVGEPADQDHPLAQHRLLAEARRLQQEGSWHKAAAVYQGAKDWRKSLPIQRQALRSLHHAGRLEEAMEMSRGLNQRHPTVQTLLVEGKLLRRANRTNEAVVALREAQAVLMRG